MIASNWHRAVDSVAAAREAAKRTDEVLVVGVSKYVGPELTQQLIQAGCQHLGENRPQLLWSKYQWMSENGHQQPNWHMIGHLQRNKVRRTLPMLSYVHSVDSVRLAQALSQEAVKSASTLPVLAEVNISQDQTKTGMPESDLVRFFEAACDLPGLQLRGLMAMASQFSGGDLARREFAEVRLLRDDLQKRYPDLELNQLSMGMSGDFREAIAEGATMIRLGSVLWEGLLS